MKIGVCRWTMHIILWSFYVSILLSFVKSEDNFSFSAEILDKTGEQQDEGVQPVKDSRGLFSPRMDYEQWKPLGRGDPLKNDPTYDYVPPVLDQVHYWIDPASRKPDAAHPTEMKKTEILILGVSSKRPSTSFSTIPDNRRDTYDPFLKFVEAPNFSAQNNYQRVHRPQYSSSQTYYSPSFYKSKPEQKEPYTILVPPPVPTHHILESLDYQQPMVSSTSTTTPVSPAAQKTSPSVAIEEANLVYQSSSLSTPEKWKGSNTYATIAESSSQVTWRTPIPESFNNTQKTMQQLPTMRAPESFKETSSFSIAPNLQPSMNVVLKPMSKLQNTKNMDTDIIVASSEIAMHKGQVTDDTLDLSSTYVSIGKPDAQMQSATGMGMEVIPLPKRPLTSPHISIKQTPIVINSPLISSVRSPVITSIGTHSSYRKPLPSPMNKLEMMPMTLQTMQTIQTMQPPPPTHNSIHKKPLPYLHGLLKKEVTPVFTTTTTAPPTTTSISSLTTDPLFKHYKQPVEPLRGPLYLIIQGHSKVKTYGPSKQINGISVQETNEILTSDDRQTEYPVKHLHELIKENRGEWDREKRDSRSGRLQTLKHIVETGLGAINYKSEEEPTRRSDKDMKETELIVKYDVSSIEEGTSEVYHKGIVESDVAPSRSDRPHVFV